MAEINGIQREIEDICLIDFLEKEGFNTGKIVVEKNLEIVPKDKYADTFIGNEDKIEILSFVGGG